MLPDYSDDIHAQRELWLSDYCAKEGDVMRDDVGEYIIIEVENGTAGDDGYSIDKTRIYLPKAIQL